MREIGTMKLSIAIGEKKTNVDWVVVENLHVNVLLGLHDSMKLKLEYRHDPKNSAVIVENQIINLNNKKLKLQGYKVKALKAGYIEPHIVTWIATSIEPKLEEGIEGTFYVREEAPTKINVHRFSAVTKNLEVKEVETKLEFYYQRQISLGKEDCF